MVWGEWLWLWAVLQELNLRNWGSSDNDSDNSDNDCMKKEVDRANCWNGGKNSPTEEKKDGLGDSAAEIAFQTKCLNS